MAKNENQNPKKRNKKSDKNLEKQQIKNAKKQDTQNDSNIENIEDKGAFAFLYVKPNITNFIFAIIIGLSSFAMYYQTTNYEFVFCDDNIFVFDDFNFNSKMDNLPKCLDRTFGTSYYRPVLGMSLLLDHQMGKKFDNNPASPKYYQWSNNIFHITGSILVFIFFILLGYDSLKSFIFGLIFTLHPILTPAASWISSRNDSMITIFILLSFIFLIKYLNSKDGTKYIYLVLNFISFAFALFTKEIASMTPFVMMIYIYFYRKETKFYKTHFGMIIGWVVIGLIWFFKRNDVLSTIKHNPDVVGISSLITNLPSVPDMIGKIFLPIHNLPLPTFDTFSTLTGIIAIAAIIYFIFSIKGMRKRNSMVGLAWFVIFLFPSLLIRIFLVDDFFDYVEHRAYLPMVGIFLVVLEILRAKKVNFAKPIPLIIALIILFSFAYKTYNYRQVFDGRKNFWQHKVDTEPNVSRGYLDLGKAYMATQELNTADSLYNIGMKLNPKNVNFYIDLCAIKLQQQNFAEAEKYGLIAAKLKPKDKRVRFNLGNALFMQNKFKESIPHFIDAVRYSGNKPDPNWLHRLAVAYHNSQQVETSLKYYNLSLSLDPDNYQVLTNYGMALMSTNKFNKATETFQKAIKLKPDKPLAYNQLMRNYIHSNNKAGVNELYKIMIDKKIELDNFVKSKLRVTKNP